MDSQENQLYQSLIIAIIVVSGIIGYFIYTFVRQQKRVVALHRKNATAVITALEKDRSRIAADLHDELAPVLSAIKMRINSFELSQYEDEQQLEKTNDAIDVVASRLRAISFDLMPASLLQKGLVTALEEFIVLIGRGTSLQIRFMPSERNLVLSEHTSIHLYRIVQEIIQNTIKHANASELLIVLKSELGRIHLFTQDNGKGFDVKKAQNESAGLGVHSLENRVSLIGGTKSVQSEPEIGTMYTIDIPLEQ